MEFELLQTDFLAPLKRQVLTSSVPAALGSVKRVLAHRQLASEPPLGAGGDTWGLRGQGGLKGPVGVGACPHSLGNAKIREESRAHSQAGS